MMSNFEKDFKTRFLPLNKRLAILETKLQKLMIASMKGAKKSTIYWNTIRREIDLIYAQMNTFFRTWAKKRIPAQYRWSLGYINSRIKSTKGVLNIAEKTLAALFSSNATTQMMTALYKDAAESFLSASVAGRNNLHRLTRMTQQILVNEGVIDITVAVGFEMGDLRKAAKALTGELWGGLYQNVENKSFVQAGKYRYKPRYYAEMVARTKFHEAQSYAALGQANNYNTDLMQISTHNTTTKICMDFEGKIFSISGKDFRFPPLSDTPPYHPNCLHLMYPTFESAMQVQGTLGAFSAFSMGEVNRPPIPAGFIPFANRKIA